MFRLGLRAAVAAIISTGAAFAVGASTPAITIYAAAPPAGEGGGGGGPAIIARPHIGAPVANAQGNLTLYAISPTTGAATPLGPIGFDGIGAMDFSPLNGKLYATAVDITGHSILITISPTTGAGTLVGPTAIAGGGKIIQDIAFRPSDGKLFAMAGSILYTVSTVTGAATQVGATGVSFTGFGGWGLAFSGPTLYLQVTDFNNAIESVYLVNPVAGAAAAIKTLDFAAPFGGGSPRANAMKFDSSGTLWASVANGESGSLISLGTINVATGHVNFVGPLPDGTDALAVGLAVAPATVPAVSTFAMVLMAITLLGAGLWAIRRHTGLVA